MTTALKHSAAAWCFCRQLADADAPAHYRRLRATGCTAIELARDHRDAARAAGVAIINAGSPIDAPANRREAREGYVASMIETMESAAAAGVREVLVFSGNRGGVSDAEGRDVCIGSFASLVPHAERLGVTLLLEVLGAADHRDYQADRSAFAFDIVRGVGSPRLRVLYDIYHMHRMGEDVARTIVENLSLLGHLHIAGSPRRDFPGRSQQIDYAAVVRAARDAGYDGWWGHEFLPTGDPLEELARAVELFESYA